MNMLSTQNATLVAFMSGESTKMILDRREGLQRLLQTYAATFEARERIESYLVQIDFELMERVAVQEL